MRSNDASRRCPISGRARESTQVRMPCWQLTDGEMRVFDAFTELESDERTAEHPTLFGSVDTAFVFPEQHAFPSRDGHRSAPTSALATR